jgi:hypothetical protein
MAKRVDSWEAAEQWILEHSIGFFNKAFRLAPPLSFAHFSFWMASRKRIRVDYAVLKLEGAIRSAKYPTASFLIFERASYDAGFTIALSDAKQNPVATLWVNTNGRSDNTCGNALCNFFDSTPENAPPPTVCEDPVAARAVERLRTTLAGMKMQRHITRFLREARKQILETIPTVADQDLVASAWIDKALNECAQTIFPPPPDDVLHAPRDPGQTARALHALLRRCDAHLDF